MLRRRETVMGSSVARCFPMVVMSTVLAMALAGTAHGQVRRRPLFEPTDLELEEAGVVEANVQMGALRSADGWRSVVPDAEIDVGLTPNVELDLDWTFDLAGFPGGRLSNAQPTGENLWFASKLGLFDAKDDGSQTTWALGMQLGPKVPLGSHANGAGFEGLVLLGLTRGRLVLAINVGGLVDPGDQVGRKRPAGIEGGGHVTVALDAKQRVSLLADVGAVVFVSSDANQLHVSPGIELDVNESASFTGQALFGLLAGGDRIGGLLGFSYKWETPWASHHPS